jgi:ribonuclease HI
MIFTDGGARGNPGPAAIAYVVLSDKGQVLTSNSRFIGSRTNNQAEYEAVIAALKSAAALHVDEVVCHLDSELVVKQLTGEYTVKNAALRKLCNKVQELSRCFRKVSFTNVPRTDIQIQKVDALVNETLDRELSRFKP